jgi:hypothetical protein
MTLLTLDMSQQQPQQHQHEKWKGMFGKLKNCKKHKRG